MTTPNLAAFTINATPSVDGNGDRIFEAVSEDVLVLTLETNPAVGAGSVTFELFDPTDDESPLASKSARGWAGHLQFDENTARSYTLAAPNDNATITIPALVDLPTSGLASWIIRCTVVLADRVDRFERGLAVNSDISGWREPVPAETTQFRKYGWEDLIRKPT